MKCLSAIATLCIPFLIFCCFCTFPVSPDFWRRQLCDLHVIVFLSPFLWDPSSKPEIAYFRELWLGGLPSVKSIFTCSALNTVFLKVLDTLWDLTGIPLITQESQSSVCFSDQYGLRLLFPECLLTWWVTRRLQKGGTAPQICSFPKHDLEILSRCPWGGGRQDGCSEQRVFLKADCQTRLKPLPGKKLEDSLCSSK